MKLTLSVLFLAFLVCPPVEAYPKEQLFKQPFVKVSKNKTTGNHVIILNQPQSKSSVRLLAYGSHIISWKHNGVEQLFCSTLSPLDGSKPIRGGIPVVFPQFARLATGQPIPVDVNQSQILSLHGFARNSIWNYQGYQIEKGSIIVTMNLDQTMISVNESRIWPFAFQSSLHIKLDLDGRLSMNMTIINKDDKPFSFDVLFHNYFSVTHVRNIVLGGLANSSYIDKTRNFSSNIESNAVYRTFGDFTDNVYKASSFHKLTLIDPVVDGTIKILKLEKFNLNSIVIWNPFERKTEDLLSGDSERFIAVEFGTVGNLVRSYGDPITLDPGNTWSGGQTFTSIYKN